MSANVSKIALPPEASKGWSLIAWQGVSFWVPEDWTLVPPGDPRETRVQAISPTNYTVQARWQPSKKQANVQNALDEYLKIVERQAKRRRVSFSGKVETAKNGNGLEYQWRSDRRAYGIARQCEVCNKVVIAEVSGGLNDSVLKYANKIFATLKDHSDDDWDQWAGYGLITSVPKRFKLEAIKPTSGYLSMRFSYRGEVLLIERWGLANIALQKFTFDQWIESALRWGTLKGERKPLEVLNHEGIQFSGKLNLIGKASEIGLFASKGKFPALNLDGAAWHCPESNRLLAISWQRRKRSQLEEMIERTLCHW